jgi:hypothetical protein
MTKFSSNFRSAGDVTPYIDKIGKSPQLKLPYNLDKEHPRQCTCPSPKPGAYGVCELCGGEIKR